jgi:FtsH-binding integral membrane protein
MFTKFKALSNFNNFNAFQKFSTKGIRNNFNNKGSGKGSGLLSESRSGSYYLKLGVLGLASGGLIYLTHQAGVNREEKLKSILYSGQTVSKEVTRNRVKNTLAYFSAGLCMTSLLTMAMTKSPRVMNLSFKLSQRPFMCFGLSLASLIVPMIGMKLPNKKENFNIKHFSWIAFNTAISFSICPLIYFTGFSMAAEAALLTAGAVGGLGYIAYISKNDAFLGLNGFLSAGVGVMMAASLGSLFFNSPILHNIWLYGGLALFMAYVLYDVNKIKIKAERADSYDPLSESVSIYMDTINIFVRILMILNDRKK